MSTISLKNISDRLVLLEGSSGGLVNLATSVTGTLPIENGGSGAAAMSLAPWVLKPSNSTLPIGSMCIGLYIGTSTNATTIANNATVAGSSLRQLVIGLQINNEGMPTPIVELGGTLPGTWRNVSGVGASGYGMGASPSMARGGLWVRTA